MLDRNIPVGNTSGMEQLSRYLKKNSIRQGEFAASVGVTQGVISRLVNGTTKPGLELAVRIDTATQGDVPVHCWVKVSQVGSGEAA